MKKYSMKRFPKRTLALILTLALIFSIVPAVNSAEKTIYSDISGHWAAPAIEKWSGYGVLRGYAGLFHPDDPITRAEMAAVLNRIIGYSEKGANPFSDVTADAWYYDDVLKLAVAGIMFGSDGEARPEDNITNEEAAALIVRAFGIPEKTDDPNPFKDAANISSWATGSVNRLHTAGYISGKPDGNFNPQVNITRAEVVAVIDNLIKAFYNKPGEYSGDINGNVVVRAAGVTLKNMNISGDLYLTEGIGSGSAALNNVKVADTTYIRGGSINVKGGNLGLIDFNSLTGTKLTLSADTKASKVTVRNTGTVVRGDFSAVFDAATGSLTLNGTYDKPILNGNSSSAVVAGGITYFFIPPAGVVIKIADNGSAAAPAPASPAAPGFGGGSNSGGNGDNSGGGSTPDSNAQDGSLIKYVNPDKYVEDCPIDYSVTVLSKVPLTSANLANYINFESFAADIPQLSVTGGGISYTITSQSPYYVAGGLYKLSLKNSGLTFSGEDPAVRTLSFRIHKEESKTVEYRDGIIDILLSDAANLGSGAYKIPADKYGAVKAAFDANAKLNANKSDPSTPDAKTTVRFWDGAVNDKTEYRNVVLATLADGGVLLLNTESRLICQEVQTKNKKINNSVPCLRSRVQGRVAPSSLQQTAAIVETVLPYNEAGENGGQDCFFILFPVFGGVMTRQKSRLSRVERVEIFSPHTSEKILLVP